MSNLPVPCAECGTDLKKSIYRPDREKEPGALCYRCDAYTRLSPRAVELAEHFRASWPSNMLRVMEIRGVPRRLLKARYDLIPQPIKDLIPKHVREATVAGSIKELKGRGMGLGGSVGCGKSAADAAIIIELLSRFVHFAPMNWDFYQRPNPDFPVVRWVHWPETFDFLQRNATKESEISDILFKMKKADLLVLDDLGKERLPKRTDDLSTPFGLSQLDLLITHRNDKMLPIFWTTNVAELDLDRIYGHATYSRLIQDNPGEWLDAPLENQRLS